MLAESALNVRIAGPRELTAWQRFVDSSPEAGPLHHAGWYHILRDAFSVSPYFLYAFDGAGDVVGILPTYFSRSLITGRHLSSLEGGVLAKSSQAAEALVHEGIRLRDSLRAGYLQLRGGPLAANAEIIPTVHTIIDTRQNVDQLWSAVKGKTRWGVRQAEKSSLGIERDLELSELDAFYGVYAAHMRDLGTPVFSRTMLRAMKAHLGPERLRLYLARRDGELIGGMLCILHGNSWTDWFAIMRYERELEFANYMLYWHVIRDASLNNVESLDLGRSAPGSNVHLFKRKWRGRDIDVPYQFYVRKGRRSRGVLLQEQRTSRSVAQRVWSHLPLTLSNALGPVIRDQLPFI